MLLPDARTPAGRLRRWNQVSAHTYTYPRPSPTPALTVYRGNGYSIGYPKDWTVTPGDHEVTFMGASGLYTFIAGAHPNPGGSVDASTVASKSIAAVKATKKNPQTVPLPPTTTVIVGSRNP